MSRILVIGAQGALGTVVAQALREDGHDVLRGGRRPESDTPGDLRHVDLDDPATLAGPLAEVDLAVSTVWHPQLAPERFVLRHGGLLVSVASLSLADRLALKAERHGACGTVLVHAGVNPGLMTVLLAELLDAHPESTWVEVASVVPALQTMGGLALDSTWPFLTAQPRRPVARIPFAQPVGVRRCLQLGSGEEGWLGELASGREGRTWMAQEQWPVNAVLLAVNRAGLLHRLPRPVFRHVQSLWHTSPSDKPKRDRVAVGRGRDTIAVSSIAGDGDYRIAALATAAFCDGTLTRHAAGTLPPGVAGAEEVFGPAEIAPALAAHGVQLIRGV